jgi:hypothetical protein
MLVKLTTGVNFTNIICAAFSYLDLRFVLFWRKNIGAKAACIMLVKLTPVNFINIICAAFAPPMFCAKKVQTLNLITKQFRKKHSYKKAERKILVKLTPVPNSDNLYKATTIYYQTKIQI